METREHGVKVELMGRKAEMESKARRLEVKPGDQQTRAELETWWIEADKGNLRLGGTSGEGGDLSGRGEYEMLKSL